MGKIGDTTPFDDRKTSKTALNANEKLPPLASADVDANHVMHLVLLDASRYDELELFLNLLYMDFQIEDDIPNAFSFERSEDGSGVTVTLIQTTGEKMLGYIDENHLRPQPEITSPSPR